MLDLTTVTHYAAQGEYTGSHNAYTTGSEALKDEICGIADLIEHLGEGESIVIRRVKQ